VDSANERFSEYTLEDGSVVRIKSVVTSFVRIDGQWDQEGNPMYVIKAAPILTVVSAPEHLRRKLQ
jgi:hypothetical protein